MFKVQGLGVSGFRVTRLAQNGGIPDLPDSMGFVDIKKIARGPSIAYYFTYF